jgi:magnesium chelatase subunit I
LDLKDISGLGNEVVGASPDSVARSRGSAASPATPKSPHTGLMRPVFPFSAIAGQEDMKQALLVAAVDPGVGGVLVLGDRGTGKSTAVRALAQLLPDMTVVAGCRYGCDPKAPPSSCDGECRAKAGGKVATVKARVPVVDLPLGATEDRVVGALDLERALTRGEKAFEPGLLAKAHRGFLYIDEVNLLEDHLVDLLLDVAASGENVVEREGLSVRHPARFVLVGSGNPEEGDLRPQLLDRFGLALEVRTPTDIATRIEVVKRRDAFERDPQGFVTQWAEADDKVRRKIVAGRKRLETITVAADMLEAAAKLCLALGTDGLRGELTLMRTARALAALEGAKETGVAHLKRIAPSALRHRLRRNPLDDSGSDARIARAMAEVLG